MNARFPLRLLTAFLVLLAFGAVFYLYGTYTPHSVGYEPPAAAAEEPAQEPQPLSAPEPAPDAAEPEEAGPEEPTPEEAEPEEPAPAEPTPEPTVDPDSPAGRAAALGLPAPPEIDVDSWEFVLVNGDHSIGEYEPPELAYLNQTADATDIQYTFNANRCKVDSRIAQPLLDMALACKAEGLPVYLSSGYRSYSDQAANFQRINQNNGTTDGKNWEGHYITMPAGCSEHQTGLAADITDVHWEIKNDAVAEVPTVQWLAQHCAEYGFILRFPAEKRDITNVMGESWHFRYVGKEAAAYIMDNDLCLEEFLALYGVE